MYSKKITAHALFIKTNNNKLIQFPRKDENKMLTSKQVAEALGVTKMTVSRLIRKGDLQAYKVGGQYRIRAKDLRAYWGSVSTTAKFDEDYIAPDGGGITYTKQNKKDSSCT